MILWMSSLEHFSKLGSTAIRLSRAIFLSISMVLCATTLPASVTPNISVWLALTLRKKSNLR